MQLTGNMFAQLGAELGHEISTLPDFPAEIRAPQGTLGGTLTGKLIYSLNNNHYEKVSLSPLSGADDCSLRM